MSDWASALATVFEKIFLPRRLFIVWLAAAVLFLGPILLPQPLAGAPVVKVISAPAWQAVLLILFLISFLGFWVELPQSDWMVERRYKKRRRKAYIEALKNLNALEARFLYEMVTKGLRSVTMQSVLSNGPPEMLHRRGLLNNTGSPGSIAGALETIWTIPENLRPLLEGHIHLLRERAGLPPGE